MRASCIPPNGKLSELEINKSRSHSFNPSIQALLANLLVATSGDSYSEISSSLTKIAATTIPTPSIRHVSRKDPGDPNESHGMLMMKRRTTIQIHHRFCEVSPSGKLAFDGFSIPPIIFLSKIFLLIKIRKSMPRII